jgi:16S rRNA (guanine527-N7)-methyltransferase
MAIGFDRTALTAMLKKGATELALALSDMQLERLMDYLALLAKWNTVYNLTAVRDPSQMVVQHLLDSLAAVPAFAQARRVLDVGSGGGLPGMVLAIWAAESRPSLQVSMIDTVHKKTAFLTQVKAELELKNVKIYTGRVEEFQTEQPFDVITSRAFADLSDFVNWSGHLLNDDGMLIAMKGVATNEETDRLPRAWHLLRKTPLTVPGLDAERHLVFIARAGER